MTSLQRLAAEALGAALLCGAFFGWWKLHNHEERRLGAAACIQATTISKSVAKQELTSDQTAQAADINTVVKGYDSKVVSLSASNDDLSRRLSDAVRQNGVSHPGPAACPSAADPGLSQGESSARERLGQVRADLKAVLDACDANQVKTEDMAMIYDKMRARALAAGAVQLP